MVKVWLWSAVTMISVSCSLVMAIAIRTALDSSIVSCSALLALPAWWAWSMRPASTCRK